MATLLGGAAQRCPRQPRHGGLALCKFQEIVGDPRVAASRGWWIVGALCEKQVASRTMPRKHLLGALQGQPPITEIQEILGDFNGAAAWDFLDGSRNNRQHHRYLGPGPQGGEWCHLFTIAITIAIATSAITLAMHIPKSRTTLAVPQGVLNVPHRLEHL